MHYIVYINILRFVALCVLTYLLYIICINKQIKYNNTTNYNNEFCIWYNSEISTKVDLLSCLNKFMYNNCNISMYKSKPVGIYARNVLCGCKGDFGNKVVVVVRVTSSFNSWENRNKLIEGVLSKFNADNMLNDILIQFYCPINEWYRHEFICANDKKNGGWLNVEIKFLCTTFQKYDKGNATEEILKLQWLTLNSLYDIVLLSDLCYTL